MEGLWLRAALLVGGAFLLGSLPFGLWIGWIVARRDIRRAGSGNLGATNVLRVLGARWGLLTLALDVGKGWAAVAVLPGLAGLAGVASGGVWPLAGFRGGKGVATSLGAFLALAPLAAGAGMAGFLVCLRFSGYVSLSSLTMAVIFPVVASVAGPPAPLHAYVVALGALLAVVIALRHRANWRRIGAGSEPRFRWRRR
jgi:glycerol-3-phosphate acyltransferase PlsY